MKAGATVSTLWEALKTSYWFVPSLFALFAVLLAFVTLRLDAQDHWVSRLPILGSGSVDGARAVLSAIATSSLSLAGVIFSITIVAMALAANQFGPRLLRNYRKDTGNRL